MRARRLIDNSTFGPEDLQVITKAFEEAWTMAGRKAGTDPVVIDDMRTKLAAAILNAASTGVRDVEALITAGLLSIGVNYQRTEYRRN
jgi:hypothetical protein